MPNQKMRNDRYLVLRDEEVWKVAIAWIYLRPSFGAATEKKIKKKTRLYSARKKLLVYLFFDIICSSKLTEKLFASSNK